MKKIFTLMLLAAAPLLAQAQSIEDFSFSSSSSSSSSDQGPQYGYFWVDDVNEVITPNSSVSWTRQFHSKGISISPLNKNVIIIENPGVYRINFVLFGAFDDYLTPIVGNQPWRFALFLDGLEIPNSTYAISGRDSYPSFDLDPNQNNGQVIVKIPCKNAQLELRNVGTTTVTLLYDVVPYGGANVAAGIYIDEIGSLQSIRK